MRKYFTFDGTRCDAFGIYAGGYSTLASTERDYDMVSIPGSSGDLTFDNGRWKNQQLTYYCGITAQFLTNYESMRAFFMSHIGYFRLEDDFNIGQYRRAIFTGNISPDVTQYARAGRFSLTFNAMPQRWLLSGEEAVPFTADGTITNPTLFNAAPLVRVYGAGTVGVGTEEITVASNDYDFIEIDCKTGDATYNTINANALISVTGDSFPALGPGENGITLSGIERVEIVPRWYTL